KVLAIGCSTTPVAFFDPRTGQRLSPKWQPPKDISLFNGRDLTGWTARGEGKWFIADGALVGVEGKGRIMAAPEFTDFELTLEYRIPAGGDAGIFLRASPVGSARGHGFLELQLLDDTSPRTQKYSPEEKNGALYNVVAPLATPKAPPGEWNTVRVRFVGSQLIAEINGTKTLDLDLRDAKYRN